MLPFPSFVRLLLPCVLLIVGTAAPAQDAVRGAQLYLQLPDGATSCIGCHGPDPAQNPNNILRAADRPNALLQALNTVSRMGYLRQSLSDTDIADLAAYLGRVLQVASPTAPVALWPTTVEFGAFAAGAVVPVHRVELRNQGTSPFALAAPQLLGSGHTMTSDCGAALAPGAVCRIELRAIAAAPGRAASTLVLAGGGAWSPLMLGMTSTVRDGPLGVLSADLPDAPLDFAGVTVGESSVREFALLSHGAAAVTLGAMTVTGPQLAAFRAEGDCVRGLVLAPGSRCTMRLRFVPGAALQAAATLQWRTDGGNPGTLALSGTGLAASAPPTAPPAADAPSGGGCSIGRADRPADPLHAVLVVLAIAVLAHRRRTSRRPPAWP